MHAWSELDLFADHSKTDFATGSLRNRTSFCSRCVTARGKTCLSLDLPQPRSIQQTIQLHPKCSGRYCHAVLGCARYNKSTKGHATQRIPLASSAIASINNSSLIYESYGQTANGLEKALPQGVVYREETTKEARETSQSVPLSTASWFLCTPPERCLGSDPEKYSHMIRPNSRATLALSLVAMPRRSLLFTECGGAVTVLLPHTVHCITPDGTWSILTSPRIRSGLDF